jgi:hypothetical protein
LVFRVLVFLVILFSELDIGPAVIGDPVEFGGFAKALTVLIDDGWKAESRTVVTNGDGDAAEVSRGFVADGIVAEGVVTTDFAGAFTQEEFAVVVVV